MSDAKGTYQTLNNDNGALTVDELDKVSGGDSGILDKIVNAYLSGRAKV